MRLFATFILLIGVWLLWSGHYEPLLISFGVGSALVVTLIAKRLSIVDAESFPFEFSLGLLTYLPWLLWQIVLANVEVARLILSPKPRLKSHLIHLDVSQRTTFGQVVHANTITITPGTITLDVRDNTFLIHALTEEMAAEDVAGAIDRRARRMEGRRT